MGEGTGYVGSSSIYKGKILIFGTHGRLSTIVFPNHLVKERISSSKASYLWLVIGGVTAHTQSHAAVLHPQIHHNATNIETGP